MSFDRPLLWTIAGVAALALAAPSQAAAKSKKDEKYLFSANKVSLVEGIPAAIEARVRAQLTEAIAKHTELITELPADAPDPKTEPKKYEKYLAAKGLRAFKVNVEVTLYAHELQPMPAPRRGQRLKVSITLRTFGETIPGRVMAFSGEGSSTVILEIGKKLRKRDSEVANHDSIELAIAEALERSIKKLREPPPIKKSTKKAKKKRSKK